MTKLSFRPMSRMRIISAVLGLSTLGLMSGHVAHAAIVASSVKAAKADAALIAAVNGSWRPADSKARDQYRHPQEALTFWGLKPGMKIVEIEPGGKGWWVEILAPYAKATGGAYVAALPDRTDPSLNEQQKAARQGAHDAFKAEVADKNIYGSASGIDFGPKNLNAIAANSTDFVLVARAFHNWSRSDRTDPYLKAIATMLKPGGVLAVEQHRAKDGSDPKAGTGYVSEAYVIDAAKKAGLVFEGRSEINANPKDTKDHPFAFGRLSQSARRMIRYAL